MICPLSFQSTPSPRRETVGRHNYLVCSRFQSTPSPRRETYPRPRRTSTNPFQSTPSPRRETQRIRLRRRTHSISIHSLPKEGDLKGIGAAAVAADFNPLPPQGGRQGLCDTAAPNSKFQSTPSPRRETSAVCSFEADGTISIHSLPKEGDRLPLTAIVARQAFQSTPSPRRETRGKTPQARHEAISIHSLPKEGDGYLVAVNLDLSISIHSLPKEGDRFAPWRLFL